MIPTVKTLGYVSPESVGYVLDQSNANLAKTVDRMNLNGLTDGVLLTGIQLSDSDTPVDHNLGRQANWIVVSIDQPEQVYVSSSENPAPNSILLLKATGDVTVNLLVF